MRKLSMTDKKNFVVRLGVCGGLGEFLFFWVCVGFWRICHFERSEKSTEFETHFKTLKSHFDFMDTSLRSV